MTVLKPGDLIFYPDDGAWRHNFFAWLQKIGGEMGKIEPPGYTHVAMVSSEPDLIVQMKWPRPSFEFFADDMRPKVIYRPMCTDEVKMRAIYWCYMNINDHYSFLNMILGKFGVMQCHKVCSGWIDTAYKMAGFPLTPETDKMTSPNELASSGVIDYVMRSS